LQSIPINGAADQFLLYIDGVGWAGKDSPYQVFSVWFSIIPKRDDILFPAATGAAAANISSATYHSTI